jgi:large subunit ribosomal protein L18
MIKHFNANKARLRRHRRVRKRVQGTAERPRLSVFRSAEHIYAQIIDDEHGQTLVAASSLEKNMRGADGKTSANGAAPQQTLKGAKAAQAAKAEAPAGKSEKGGKVGKGGKAEQAAPAPAPAEPAEVEDGPAGLKGIATNHKVVVAQSVGRLIAERAREQGITKVVFDRGGYIYHGRVAALAAGAREGGLDF